MQEAGQWRQLGLFLGFFQHSFQRCIVDGLCLPIELVATGGQLGVDAAAIIGAQHTGEQVAIFEPGDQSRRGAGAQCGGARQLRHAHMPAVLPVQGIEKCVLDHRKPDLGGQVFFKCGID